MNECPYRSESYKSRKKESTTSKRVVWFILFNSIVWIYCSYILAYLQRAEIAEELSKVALTSIVATTLGYFLKALFENISKNNTWPDKAVNSTDPSLLGGSDTGTPIGSVSQDCDNIL